MTRYLLSAGAKSIIDQRDEDGVTALIHASYANRAETVQILLDEGADVDVEDNSGNTAKKCVQLRSPQEGTLVDSRPSIYTPFSGGPLRRSEGACSVSSTLHLRRWQRLVMEQSDRGLDTFAMCTWLSQPQALLALAAMAWAAERRPEIFLYIARNAVTGNLSFSGSEFLSIDTSCVPRAPALAGLGLGPWVASYGHICGRHFGGALVNNPELSNVMTTLARPPGRRRRGAGGAACRRVHRV